MLNLIQMDLYRMFHSVSTWVILIFAAAAAVFTVSMANIDVSAMAEDPQYAQESVQEKNEDSSSEELQLGIYAESDPEWVSGNIDAGEMLSIQIKSGVLTLLCIIFAAVFGSADFKNGYIKNIAGQLKNRGVLAVSKFTASAVQVFLMMLLFTIFTFLTGEIFWGERFVLGAVTEMLPFLGAQYLLNLGFAALILLLCTLTKSSAFGMTAGILIVMRFSIPVYSLINRGIAEIRPSWNFDINKYMLDGNMGLAGINASPEILTRAAVVGAAFVAVCIALAALAVKKQDVR